MAKASNYMFRP